MTGMRWLCAVAAIITAMMARPLLESAHRLCHPILGSCELTMTAAALLIITAAIGIRASLLTRQVARAAKNLPPTNLPTRAQAIARQALSEAERTRLHCVSAVQPVAFCTGLFRPRIYVTTGLIAACDDLALEAVLRHEFEHARRRDPLRRVLGRTLADVVFLVPMVRWWNRRSLERSELAADRAALTHLPPGALVRAMDAAAPPVSPFPAAAAAFDGAAEARVAQLLGDPHPETPPTAGELVMSTIGLAIAVWFLTCPM